MARQKALAKYPSHYALLFKLGSRREVDVHLASPDAARQLRNHLYNYRAVLRRNARFNEKYQEAIEAAETVVLEVKGTTLIARPRGTTNDQ